MTRPDTNTVGDKRKRPRIVRMAVEFLAGTDFKEAVEEMWNLHYETKADIETTFNDMRVIIANNEMFEKFGYRKTKV